MHAKFKTTSFFFLSGSAQQAVRWKNDTVTECAPGEFNVPVKYTERQCCNFCTGKFAVQRQQKTPNSRRIRGLITHK